MCELGIRKSSDRLQIVNIYTRLEIKCRFFNDKKIRHIMNDYENDKQIGVQHEGKKSA